MRTQGIADLGDVRYAILEQNGKISFLKESDSPNIMKTLVIDSKPDERNLKLLGYNEEWLEERLKEKHVKLGDVFLMTINENDDINIIKKEEGK